MEFIDIFQHTEYLNPHFNFDDEVWTDIVMDGVSNYKKSNYFRVKNIQTNNIIKPWFSKQSKKYSVSIRSDKKDKRTLQLTHLFDDMNDDTDESQYKNAMFIYNAF